METNPNFQPPEEKKSIVWPIAVNIGLLLLSFLIFRSETGMLITLASLVVVNAIAAFIMALSSKMNYVVALILSTLIVLLIGLGICGIMLSGSGSGGYN